MLDDGTLVVTDAGRGVANLFARDGKHLGSAAPAGGLRRPMHAVGAGDTLWVAEFLTDRVLQLDRRGEVLRTVSAGFDAPSAVAIPVDGALFVPDFYNHQLVSIAADGKTVARWGSGRKGVAFNYPSDVALSPDGRIVYVADAYAHRIVALKSLNGEVARTWGSKGSAPGQFDVATGVTTCAKGLIYVADFYNHRIQVFHPDGTLVALFGAQGAGPGEFDRPTDIVVARNRLFIVDSGNHRIEVFVWARR